MLPQSRARRVLADLTNTASAHADRAAVALKPSQKEVTTASRGAADEAEKCPLVTGETASRAEPFPSELGLVAPCSMELHQVWVNFAAAGGSTAPFLLQHFASLSAQVLRPPSRAPPPPSEAVLRPRVEESAVGPAAEVCGDTVAEECCWSEVMSAIHDPSFPSAIGADAPCRHTRSRRWQNAGAELRNENRVSDSPGERKGGESDEKKLLPCGSQSRLEISRRLFDDSENSEDKQHLWEEEEEQDASDDEDLLPPRWRQKELCEEELEKRLADLLEQEQLDQFSAGDFEGYDQDGQCTPEVQSTDTSYASWSGADADAPRETLALESVGSAPAQSGPLPAERWVFQTPVRRRSRKAGPLAVVPLIQETTSHPAPAASSQNSRLVSARDRAGSEPGQIDAVLDSMTTSLLRAYHRESERCRLTVGAEISKISAAERVLTVDWLLQTCRAMSFPEVVPFTAVLLFDRYCAKSSTILPAEQMQVLFLSVISIALKMHGISNLVPAPLRDVLAHLGQYQVPVEKVLELERQVLQALDFQVSTPTVQEFLDLLSVRSRGAPSLDNEADRDACDADSRVWELAAFLLRLAIREVGLLYRYPHSVLAASAAYLALWSCAALEASREEQDTSWLAEPSVESQGAIFHQLYIACSAQSIGRVSASSRSPCFPRAKSL